jgi:preprotein translocase subunit YajC
MGTNWIILSIVLLAVIGLILFLIVRNQKDKKEVTTSLDTDTDTEDDYERDKDRE